VQRCDQVQFDDPGVEPRRRGGGRGRRRAARVADHDVHAAEQVHRGRDQLPNLFGVPDVRAGERGGPALRGGQGIGVIPAAYEHLRAGPQEPSCEAGADAPRAASHDHPAAGKAGE
jgi:hypothetical protein